MVQIEFRGVEDHNEQTFYTSKCDRHRSKFRYLNKEDIFHYTLILSLSLYIRSLFSSFLNIAEASINFFRLKVSIPQFPFIFFLFMVWFIFFSLSQTSKFSVSFFPFQVGFSKAGYLLFVGLIFKSKHCFSLKKIFPLRQDLLFQFM